MASAIANSVQAAMLANWRLMFYSNYNPERYIDCCEWCGKDTRRFGRWKLVSGEGLSIILCTLCADMYDPLRYCDCTGVYPKDGTAMEVVPCQR